MGPDRPTGKEEQDFIVPLATIQLDFSRFYVSSAEREDGPGESVTVPEGEMKFSRREG